MFLEMIAIYVLIRLLLAGIFHGLSIALVLQIN